MPGKGIQSPATTPLPPTLQFFPHPQAVRDPQGSGGGVRGVGHSQSLGAKVWDKGQPTDF